MLFLLPVLFGYILQQLYGVVDAMILGKYVSKNALASVYGSSTQFLNIILNLVSGICAGVTIMIAQNYGRGNYEKVHRIIETSFLIAIVISVLVGLVVFVFSNGILELMSTPTELISDSSTYIRFYMLSLIPYFLYNVGISILRATGDTKRPLFFIIINCVSKILLDILLTVVFKLGVLGVSIATLVSYIICCVVILFMFKFTSDIYQISLREIKYDRESVKEILRIGLPAAIQSSLFAIANLFIQIKINTFGTDVMAAYSAYNSVDNYFWCISNSLNAAVLTLVGQNFGNKNLKRVRSITYCGIVIDIIGGLLCGGVLLIFGREILKSYLNEQHIIEISYQMLKVVAVTYFIYSFVESISATLKGVGQVVIPMNVAFICICVVRILYLSLAPLNNPTEVIYCYPISWIISAIVFIIIFITNKKLKVN